MEGVQGRGFVRHSEPYPSCQNPANVFRHLRIIRKRRGDLEQVDYRPHPSPSFRKLNPTLHPARKLYGARFEYCVSYDMF